MSTYKMNEMRDEMIDDLDENISMNNNCKQIVHIKAKNLIEAT